MMPVIISYLTIIQPFVQMHLRMLDYIDATTKQQRKKDVSFMITCTNHGIAGHDVRPMHATCFSESNGYREVNDHCDVTLGNYNEIEGKYDEITNNKITHIDDGYKLIVLNDETNHKVKIVFYDTSSSENVITTDMDANMN